MVEGSIPSKATKEFKMQLKNHRVLVKKEGHFNDQALHTFKIQFKGRFFWYTVYKFTAGCDTLGDQRSFLDYIYAIAYKIDNQNAV